MKKNKARTTTVGMVDEEVLAYTAGDDAVLDEALIEADCLATAAHVTMLSKLPLKPPLFTAAEKDRIVKELSRIVEKARRGRFSIALADQDVHLAVERELTAQLGALGKKVHSARSRNDLVTTDLRLYAKSELLDTITETAALADALLDMAMEHEAVPMVGRTHMQPAMPSSVGLWASAHAESLLDDVVLLVTAYDLNDQSPLGSAAGYGVPMPIDRQMVSDLLGFSRPIHNVMYAGNARGKIESITLGALGQVMLTLSRFAQDLMLFTMPEFAYFTLPAGFCTGSSIMPQKRNPDVLEIIRARAAKTLSLGQFVSEVVRASPSGYNRDIQETKSPLMEGFRLVRSTLWILMRMVPGICVNKDALLAGFTPEVYATDRALELVADGMPFRDAYHHVKAHLDELDKMDPVEAVKMKKHVGAPAGLNFGALGARVQNAVAYAEEERAAFEEAKRKLLRHR